MVEEGFGKKIDRKIIDRIEKNGDVEMEGNENKGKEDIKKINYGMKLS